MRTVAVLVLFLGIGTAATVLMPSVSRGEEEKSARVLELEKQLADLEEIHRAQTAELMQCKRRLGQAAEVQGLLRKASHAAQEALETRITELEAQLRKMAVDALQLQAEKEICRNEAVRLDGELKRVQATRDSMRRAFFDAGADAVPILVASMREHRDSAGWALPLLGDLGSKAKAAIPFVKELAALGEENIRGKAATAALEKIRAAIAAEMK